MSRKHVVKSYKMVDAGDMSTASITSSETNVLNLDQASIDVSWSGTSPVGVLTVEAKNGDYGSWYTLDFNTTMNVTGNTGSHQIVFNSMPFTDMRLVYTKTSGSGTLNAILTMKTVGA